MVDKVGTHCDDCKKKHEFNDHISQEILWDLCYDLPYDVECDVCGVVIDSSDGSGNNRVRGRLHILTEVCLRNATIRLRSMGNYVAPILETSVSLCDPNYRKSFYEAIDRIRKIRQMLWAIEISDSENGRDSNIDESKMNKIKEILNDNNNLQKMQETHARP